MPLFKSIFADRKFAPFFWVLFLGAFNDNVIKNVLVILVAYKGIELYGLGAETLVSIIGALFILPFVVFSPFSGSLADKYNKVLIMRWVKWAEVGIMILAGVGFLLQNYLLLILAVFFMGVQSTFFGPIKYSISPELVKKKEISSATGLIELGTFLSILLGTILGGYLSTLESWSIIAFILVVISIVGLLFSYLQPVHKTQVNKKLKLSYNIFGGHINLFKVIMPQKKIFTVTILISMFWFLGAGLLTLLPALCKNILNVSEIVVTFFLAMFTLGIAIGSLLGAKLSKQKVEMGLVPIGALGVLLFSADLYYVFSSWPLPFETMGLNTYLASENSLRGLLDFLGLSTFGGLFILPLYAYLQEFSKKQTLSRVIAVNNILNAFFMVLVSVLIILFIGAKINSITSILLITCMYFVISLVIFSTQKSFRDDFISYIGRLR